MADEVKHELVERSPGGWKSLCSCGEWEAGLGESIRTGFDRHLISVGQFDKDREVVISLENGLDYNPMPTEDMIQTLGRCVNSQCKVESFKGDRCPACYGAGK